MLAHVLFVLLAGVPMCRGSKGAKGAPYSEYYDAAGDVQNTDFYDSYNDELLSPQMMTTVTVPITSFERTDLEDIKTLNSEEIIDVKEILINILEGKKPGFLRGRRPARDYTGSSQLIKNSINNQSESSIDQGPMIKNWQPIVEVQISSSTVDEQEYLDETSHPATEQHWTFVYQPETFTYDKHDIIAEVRKMITVSEGQVPSRSAMNYWRPTQDVQTWSTTEETEDTLMYPLESTTYSNSGLLYEVRKLARHWSSVNTQESTTTNSNSDMQAEVRPLDQDWSSSSSENETSSYNNVAMRTNVRLSTQHQHPSGNVQSQTLSTLYLRQLRNKSTPKMDINALLAIIANLTYDYEWNLTDQFNKTILEHGVPTCAPYHKWGPGGAWTATTLSTTLYNYDFENSSIVSKCFVCGLTTREIPRNAHCADAFAGDFLPLMPIDARARGKIAGFRKYCRYIDTQNYIENPDEPRAIYGRFTGGCAVRWTDLTGVYTQRTCRSKYRPLMGKHLASKRMARLELALVNVENGCIISPMATLLPVSRGISLYARFHACVCSTNWCNRATLEQASFNILGTIVLAYWLVHYP